MPKIHAPALVAWLAAVIGVAPCSISAADRKAAATDGTPVTVQVDANSARGPLEPVWAYFGYDEPNYTYAPHGAELISELGSLSRIPVRIRAHNLLTTGDGTPSPKWGSTNAYTEDASGNPVYNWTILDRIFDAYIHSGVQPYVEIGFMPEALSIHPEPYRHHFPRGPLFTGWSYPPKDYAKWAELVRQWTLHCVARYGRQNAAAWDWEVWNEPDIGYWHGTLEDYEKLYDYTANAVHQALPEARVGGPAVTGPSGRRAADFLRGFLEHCATGKNFATGKTGAPLDFISFHAKGNPSFAEGHQRMGLAHELRDVAKGFEIVRGSAKFSRLPVVISEADPDGCAACTPKMDPRYGYRNSTLYPAYTAAALQATRQLAAKYQIRLQGFLTWAFEFEDQPIFSGYRALATQGVDKAQLNLFRMMGLMQGEGVAASSSGAEPLESVLENGVAAPNVDAIAARGERAVTVLVWNYQDDDVAGPDAAVNLDLKGIPIKQRRVLLRQYRLDRGHGNAYSAWVAMGSPENPTAEQYAQLRRAGELQMLDSPRWVSAENGDVRLNFAEPRESLSLVELSW